MIYKWEITTFSMLRPGDLFTGTEATGERAISYRVKLAGKSAPDCYAPGATNHSTRVRREELIRDSGD